jgi:6-phosphogluconolactonase
MRKSTLLIYLAFPVIMLSCSNNNDNIRLFAGKYTETSSKGLSVYEMNEINGSLKLVSDNDAGPNPSYFCISKKNNLIYAANEVMNFKDGTGGGITTLKYNPKTGTTQKIGELPIPNGSPCYISLSPENDFLFLANYTGSSVTVVNLDEIGIPREITDSIRFDGADKVSHPHMIAFSPAGKKVYQTDLGLDQVVIYDFDRVAGKLWQVENGIVKFPPGSGPRHFVFNDEGTKMYVINELNSSLSVLNVNNDGGLVLVQTFQP